MKKLFLVTIGFASLVITSANFLSANQGNTSTANQRAWKPAALRQKLGLTDDQAAKIKTEVASQKGALRAQALKVRDARASLRNAIQTNAPEPEIRANAAAVGAAEGDLAMVRANLFAHIKPILTPEQLEKLQTLQATRR